MRDLDKILVDQAMAGDLTGFETLVSRHQGKVYSFIYRMVMSKEDASDLTQEVFLQVFRSLSSFKGEAKFSTWLYRIAANKSLDYLRRVKNNKPPESLETRLEMTGSMTGSMSTNPEQIYLQEERVRRIRKMIADLPDRYRAALILFHYENLSYQQIAEALEVPVKTVATRLYRAKLILKEKLIPKEKHIPKERLVPKEKLSPNEYQGGESDGMP